jgi:sortase A
LTLGDEIIAETPDGSLYHYEVTEQAVLDYRTTSVLRPTDESTLTLVTCYPFDAIIPGGPLRYVVRAVMVGPAGGHLLVETDRLQPASTR